jgi:hypothetical protein
MTQLTFRAIRCHRWAAACTRLTVVWCALAILGCTEVAWGPMPSLEELKVRRGDGGVFHVSAGPDGLVISRDPSIPRGLPTPVVENAGSCGVEYGSGWLIGTNQGEWGGKLLHVVGALKTELLNDNVVGLETITGRPYALCGISHLSLRRGSLHEIVTANGVAQARRISLLPGTPVAWVVSGDDGLLVCTSQAIVQFNGLGNQDSHDEAMIVVNCDRCLEWMGPNSVVRIDDYYYVGTRQGVIRFKTPDRTRPRHSQGLEFGTIR